MVSSFPGFADSELDGITDSASSRSRSLVPLRCRRCTVCFSLAKEFPFRFISGAFRQTLRLTRMCDCLFCVGRNFDVRCGLERRLWIPCFCWDTARPFRIYLSVSGHCLQSDPEALTYRHALLDLGWKITLSWTLVRDRCGLLRGGSGFCEGFCSATGTLLASVRKFETLLVGSN